MASFIQHYIVRFIYIVIGCGSSFPLFLIHDVFSNVLLFGHLGYFQFIVDMSKVIMNTLFFF